MRSAFEFVREVSAPRAGSAVAGGHEPLNDLAHPLRVGGRDAREPDAGAPRLARADLTHIDVDRRLPLRLELQEHESAHPHRGPGLAPPPPPREIAGGARPRAAVFPVVGDGNARGEPLGIAPVEGHADIALAPPEPEEA